MSETRVLLDYGRGKYHLPMPREPNKPDRPLCNPYRLHGYATTDRIKFEDEVAPEDICRTCQDRAS